MPDRGEAEVAAMEAHEDFIQHIEDGRSKIRLLSVITIVVAFLLTASYFYQILLPFVSDTKVVSVNLLDPVLLVTEGLLLILGAAWLYVGIINYLFATRLGRSIQKARIVEKEIEDQMGRTTG